MRSQLLSFRVNRCVLSIKPSQQFSFAWLPQAQMFSTTLILNISIHLPAKQMCFRSKTFTLDFCCWNSSTELSMVLTVWIWVELQRLETLAFYASLPNCETSHSRRAKVKQMNFALKMCKRGWMLTSLLVPTGPDQKYDMLLNVIHEGCAAYLWRLQVFHDLPEVAGNIWERIVCVFSV